MTNGLRIRIATRKSALALWQAEYVANALGSLPEVAATELLPMSTRGDEILDRSLQKLGGKGLFIKELENAMRNGEADIAVHSMKDVPAGLPDGFCLAATMRRANHRDALVTRDAKKLEDLPYGATVGSSSLRRQAQLKILRTDLDIKPLRGNVNTRLRKFENGEFDAIVLASAGLERLGLDRYISQQFTTGEMLPAAAQGVLGIECLEENEAVATVLAKLNDDVSLRTTTAERTVARVLQASCQSPVAAFAIVNSTTLTLTALVAHPDGTQCIKDALTGGADEAESIGEQLSARLLSMGAGDLLKTIEAQYA